MCEIVRTCSGCGKLERISDGVLDSVESDCVCENKRVKCDCCGHCFLPKDLSMDNSFLALCRICNESDPYVMDNMAIASFQASEKKGAMLCVQIIGDRLQLTMRVNHLGKSIVFPAMTKQELFYNWMQDQLAFPNHPEAADIFNAAFLRLKDEYFTKEEIYAIRKQVFEGMKNETIVV